MSKRKRLSRHPPTRSVVADINTCPATIPSLNQSFDADRNSVDRSGRAELLKSNATGFLVNVHGASPIISLQSRSQVTSDQPETAHVGPPETQRQSSMTSAGATAGQAPPRSSDDKSDTADSGQDRVQTSTASAPDPERGTPRDDKGYERISALGNAAKNPPTSLPMCVNTDLEPSRAVSLLDEHVSPRLGSSEETIGERCPAESVARLTAAAELTELPEAQCDTQLACPLNQCTARFVCPRQFTAHLRQTHGDSVEDTVCVVCGDQFETAALVDCHVLDTHSAYRSITCIQCGENMAGRWSLRRHQSHCPAKNAGSNLDSAAETGHEYHQYRSGDEGEFVGVRVAKRPLQIDSTLAHTMLDREHDKATVEHSIKRPKVSPRSYDGQESRLSCSTCGQSAKSLSDLIAHNYHAHSNKVMELRSPVRNNEIIRHSNGDDLDETSNDQEILTCDKCNYRTTSSDKMQQHEAQHKCSDWIRCMRYGGAAGVSLGMTLPHPTGLLHPSQHALRAVGGVANQSDNYAIKDHAGIRSMLGLSAAGIGSIQAAAAAAACISSTDPTSPNRADRASTSPSPQYPLKESGDHLTTPTGLLTIGIGEENTEEVEDASFDDIRAMKAKGEFPCRLCEQVFPNLRAMKGHNRVHMATGPYECNVCVFSSGDKATLVRHMKQHNGERPYECRLCRFAFTTKANCERHLKNRHQLRTREQLNDAMFVHMTGETVPVQKTSVSSPTLTSVATSSIVSDSQTSFVNCPVCNAPLKQMKTLKEHLRTQHRIISCAGAYMCAVCDAKFPDFMRATQHVKRVHFSSQHLLSTDNEQETVDHATAGSEEYQTDLSKFKKQLSLSLEMPPTMVTIPNLTHAPIPRAQSPRSVSSDESANINSTVPHVDSTSENHARETETPASNGAVIGGQDTPLDLSIKTADGTSSPSTQSPPGSIDNAASEVSRNMNGLIANPLSLYMRYGGAVPFFVMPRMLGYPVDEQWRSALSQQLSIAGGASALPNSSAVARLLSQTGSLINRIPGMDVVNLVNDGNALSQTQDILHKTPKISPGTAANDECGNDVNDSGRKGVADHFTGQVLPEKIRAVNSESSASETLIQKPKQRRYRTQRPFSCCHCEARFTLSTNMDRHIKNHHPDKWERKARGARRSSSLLPNGTSLTQTVASLQAKDNQKQPDKIAIIDNEQSSVDKKEAVCNDSRAINGYQSEDDSRLVIDEVSTTAPANSATSFRRDEDLVSVSRLVDSAQAQNFQKYFGGGCCEEEIEGLEGGASDMELSLERRRSAYSSAPNKIPCRVCKREFPWTSSLRRHELTHSGEKPYQCPQCPVTFTTKSNCDRHMVRKHSENNGSCDDSGSAEYMSSLNQGTEVCSNKEYDLDDGVSECSGDIDVDGEQPSNAARSYIQHDHHTHQTQNHSTGSSRTCPYVQGSLWCHVCAARFADLHTIRDHVRLQHHSHWRQLSTSSLHWACELSELAAVDSAQVNCMVCGVMLESTTALSSHMRCHVISEESGDLGHGQLDQPLKPAGAVVSPSLKSAGLSGGGRPHTPERAKKREHLNDISARLSAASRMRSSETIPPSIQPKTALTQPDSSKDIEVASVS